MTKDKYSGFLFFDIAAWKTRKIRIYQSGYSQACSQIPLNTEPGKYSIMARPEFVIVIVFSRNQPNIREMGSKGRTAKANPPYIIRTAGIRINRLLIRK